jgi:hypothetical protein
MIYIRVPGLTKLSWIATHLVVRPTSLPSLILKLSHTNTPTCPPPSRFSTQLILLAGLPHLNTRANTRHRFIPPQTVMVWFYSSSIEVFTLTFFSTSKSTCFPIGSRDSPAFTPTLDAHYANTANHHAYRPPINSITGRHPTAHYTTKFYDAAG